MLSVSFIEDLPIGFVNFRGAIQIYQWVTYRTVNVLSWILKKAHNHPVGFTDRLCLNTSDVVCQNSDRSFSDFTSIEMLYTSRSNKNGKWRSIGTRGSMGKCLVNILFHIFTWFSNSYSTPSDWKITETSITLKLMKESFDIWTVSTWPAFV